MFLKNLYSLKIINIKSQFLRYKYNAKSPLKAIKHQFHDRISRNLYNRKHNLKKHFFKGSLIFIVQIVTLSKLANFRKRRAYQEECERTGFNFFPLSFETVAGRDQEALPQIRNLGNNSTPKWTINVRNATFSSLSNCREETPLYFLCETLLCPLS